MKIGGGVKEPVKYSSRFHQIWGETKGNKRRWRTHIERRWHKKTSISKTTTSQIKILKFWAEVETTLKDWWCHIIMGKVKDHKRRKVWAERRWQNNVIITKIKLLKIKAKVWQQLKCWGCQLIWRKIQDGKSSGKVGRWIKQRLNICIWKRTIN